MVVGQYLLHQADWSRWRLDAVLKISRFEHLSLYFQVSYHAEAFKIYSELSHQMTDKDGFSDDDYSAMMQQKLADIKALSITVDWQVGVACIIIGSI